MPWRRTSGTTPRSPTEIAVFVFLAVTVIVAPQLLGGTLGGGIVTILVMATATVVPAAWLFWVRHPPKSLSPVLFLLCLPWLWTAVQVLPWPCDGVASFALRSVTEQRAAAELLGGERAYCTISLAPGATYIELAKGISILSCFVSAWILAALGLRMWVLRAVALSVTLVAFVTLFHELVDAETVFGVYAPRYASPRLLGPLLNDNHLAGFMVLGTPLLLAMGVRAASRAGAIYAFGAATLAVAVTFMTLSRGGIAALFLGVTLVFWKMWTTRKKGRPSPRVASVALVALGGVALGVFMAVDRLIREFSLDAEPFHKLAQIRDSMVVFSDAPWVGVGRGAFASAFALHDGAITRALYPENIIVQWLSEWGLVLTLLLGPFLIGLVVRIWKREPSLVRASATAGFLALLAQNLVDFSLEMVGVATVAATMMGAVFGQSPVAHRVPDSRLLRDVAFLRVRNLAPVVAAVALGLCIWLGPSLAEHAPEQLQARLIALFENEADKEFAATLNRALELYPSEPALALIAGAEATRRRDPQALRWLNRSMQLAPGWASPHVETARFLFYRGSVDQALLEVREAAARDPDQAVPILCEFLKAKPDPDLAFRGAPKGPDGVVLLDAVSACVARNRVLSAAIDGRLLEIDGTHPRALGREAARLRAAREKGQQGSPMPDGAALQELIGSLKVAWERYPDDVSLPAELARTWLAHGDPDESLAVLDRASVELGQRAELLEVRVEALAQAGDFQGMR
ncbi:MAG: O-antigen ligase family protein, partial [Myxococcales bacterium]|nr:O-antigen ligase family protein [Myxococcales bacterium]